MPSVYHLARVSGFFKKPRKMMMLLGGGENSF